MINETMPVLIQPLVNTISDAVSILKTLVGGMFGIYLLLVFLRWKEAKDLKKLLLDVKQEIKRLNRTVSKIEKLEEK
ncbi:hypothetical protein CMO90_04290 [Candidatus Woesearchaeota archaeon]|jgi:hypothetical protein|nr:hypothetical protein [Candidatus Woesearchaeota archaeon]|tara:strand:- start:1506 stop:1736 length:231 start_codon:yes stop_codon:yes gene_type:complete